MTNNNSSIIGATNNKGQSVDVIPFGKYKGQPVDVLQSDPQYSDWLQAQDWFREGHQNIYNIIVNNFGAPDETPEHNAIQAMFLEEDFRLKVLSALRLEFIPSLNKHRVEFESGGIDVKVVIWGWLHHYKLSQNEYWLEGSSKEAIDKKWFTCNLGLAIEIKPCLGDDYPAVIRQINALHKAHKEKYSNALDGYRWVLCIEKYTGTGAKFDQVKQMMLMSGINVLLLSEILDSSPAAKSIEAPK